MGHVKTKREVIDVARRTVKKKKEKEGKFKFNGEGWWHGFVQRHPNCLYVLLMHYHIVGLML